VSYTSCIRFLTNVSLNCWYDNVEPQQARIMRMLRPVRTRGWKNSLLVHFQVCLIMVLEFVMRLDLSTHQMCLLQDCSMINFTTFTWSSQKLPSAGGECMSILMFIFCSSFHTIAGKYPSPWSLCHPASVSFSVQNSSASLFFLVYQCHSTVLS